RVERNDRCLTIAANRRTLDVDRRAAARAPNRAHARLQSFQLGGRERPHEVLLAQELEEWCKPPMTVTAAVIREPRRMLQIVRQREERLAARTRQLRRECVRRFGLRRMDCPEKVQRCAGGELRAFETVEPD